MNVSRIWGKYFGPALLAAVLALFFFSSLAAAQSLKDLPPPPPPPPTPTPTPVPTPKDEDFEVIRTTSNLVMVPVSVLEPNGQPAKGLQIADFLLEEDGRRQEIAQIGDPEDVPLEIALLLDISGSTHSRFDFEKQAASEFLKQVLKPQDRATVYVIDRVPLLKQTSANATVAANSLLAIQPAADKGPTAFFDTVLEATEYLTAKTPSQHRKVILAISDGADNFSERIKKVMGTTREEQEGVTQAVRERVYSRAISEVQRNVQSADAVFYAINPSGETMHLNILTKRGHEGLRQIADATGGNVFVPGVPEDLPAVFNQIAAELRGQYLLQYYSNSQATGGGFRRIKVGLPTRAQYRLRARQGYYPKQAKAK
ncbi:MAG TPA: VWA domain-containing protein [Pyrinomonadaceae bacterium]|nr:VWA domain-containing protein [Pyrinomonadaceae bacterium]